MSVKTTNDTETELWLNNSSIRLTIPSGKILSAIVNVVGSKSDGTAVARYTRQVTIKNVSGTTALVGSVETIGVDVEAATALAITANDTNDAIKIAVTGIASETWRWVAVVNGVELIYGA
jgi:MinD-like ATPase involved in chromosome partitioning or flagellar assembly